MIIADSSVWIEHLRHTDATLQAMLDVKQVLIHPFVIGELALGHLRQRDIILDELRKMPHALPADDEEALDFIERNALAGTGVGYIDAHLLASARLSSALLWARDRRLNEAAARLGLVYKPH